MKYVWIRSIALALLLTIIQLSVFFLSAGHFQIPRAWLYFGITCVYFVLSNIIVYQSSPDLVAQRLTRRRVGSKRWDDVLMRVNNLILLIVVPMITGFDVGRFLWSNLSIDFLVSGVGLYLFSSVLVVWAMVVNPFFESTVRIQTERAHTVITKGPYRWVRHPGYVGAILWAISIPLIFGSVVACVPVGLYVGLTGFRTFLEDRTLMEELCGYSEYAVHVRYRLFPFIW
ncbi:MAG: isoprenylcysteine carboxylmethyltransferase family protein [Candidatus Bathyarchaeota archaeon]|nr:isoprenylcysteine carboxylmethyltransferase family protein [Candidatus Bathyarchaeota archaeon]